MQPFTILTGIAAPLPLVNVDTDMIIPKQFLKTIERSGLGRSLFDDMRRLPDGAPNPDFILNQAPWTDAKIMVSGANFGCGSSREHAPWALQDFGIRCVIAPSFADIFFNNCFKNGMLPVVLPQDAVDGLLALAADPATATMTVDLEAQTVTDATGATHAFTVDAFRRHCLLNGLDDIGLTLQQDPAIAAFEAAQRQSQPWLWTGVKL